MKINWKIRLRNKIWLLTAIGAIVSLVYQFLTAFGVTPNIGQEQVMNWVASLLSVLAMIGVVIDPTTPGSADSDRAMTYGAPVSADQVKKDEAAVIEAGDQASAEAEEKAAEKTEADATVEGTTVQETPTQEETKTAVSEKKDVYKGIDVSAFQGTIDWSRVRADGVAFAFIRVGGRFAQSGKLYADSHFDENIKNSTAQNIHTGVYFFSQAITEAEAEEEADYTINKIKGYAVDCPVVIDTESLDNSRGNAMTRAQRTAVMKAFCNRVKEAGYEPMIYASTSWANNQLDMSQLSAYRLWVAQYYSVCQYEGTYDAWQYTSSGKVDGVSGSCDMNHGYAAWWSDGIESVTTKQAVATKPASNITKTLTSTLLTITQQQLFLKTYFYYYKGAIDGIKGTGTISGIKAFQKAQGLTVDGIWGPNTDAKARSCARALQAKLGVTQDGIVGAQTVGALKTYQETHGLTADGIMGPATYNVLFLGKSATTTTSSGLPAGYISPHFRKIEFRCGCGGKYCDGYNGKEVDQRLLNILERIRAYYGKPITITSGIRCQRFNDSLRGSIKTSVHRLGGAADIYIPGVTTTAAGRAQVKKLAYQYGAKYCYYGTANMGNAVHINV